MIKEQLKQENQRKLFGKSLFMTIRPEFNNGGAIEAVAIVLFKFFSVVPVVSVVSLLSFRWFRFVVSVVSFRCFGF